jgi:flagellar export protein FliJ
MKRFRFPLQSVHALREQKERAAQQRFADALRECEGAAARAQRISLQLESCWAVARADLRARTTTLDLARTSAYASLLEEHRKRATAEWHAAQRRVEDARQVLLRTTRDRDVLDHYRDKLLRIHQREARRDEQKQLDEVGGRLAAASGVWGSRLSTASALL